MHSVMSPDGDYLYVANEMDTSVSAVRCADRTVRHTYVHGTPTDVSIAPGGDYLLVPVPARDRLLKVRTSDMSLSDSISEAGVTRVAVSPDGGHAFVLRPIDMSLDVVKLPDMVVEATIPLDSFPEDVVVCGTGDTLCVLDAGGRVISIVDVGQRAVVNQVVLNQLSKYVAMLPGTSCLIASFGQIGAYYIDVQHGVLVDSATSDGFHFAYGVTANPTGTRVYIANEDGIVVFGKR